MHVLSSSSVSATIPPTITDQIRLWEQERDRSHTGRRKYLLRRKNIYCPPPSRFVFTDGVLYNQFLSQADYETVRNSADELG